AKANRTGEGGTYQGVRVVGPEPGRVGEQDHASRMLASVTGRNGPIRTTPRVGGRPLPRGPTCPTRHCATDRVGLTTRQCPTGTGNFRHWVAGDGFLLWDGKNPVASRVAARQWRKFPLWRARRRRWRGVRGPRRARTPGGTGPRDV